MRGKTFIFLTFFAVFMTAAAHGQTLPAAVQNYLNANYSGWRIAGTSSEFCSPDFQKGVVSGDLDGDGRRDHSVKFIAKNRSYIIAFLDRKTTVKPFLLVNRPGTEATDWGMKATPPGQMSPAGKLRTAAIMVGPCASEAGFFIYRNGKFKAY